MPKEIIEIITNVSNCSKSSEKKKILEEIDLNTDLGKKFITYMNYVYNEADYVYNIKNLLSLFDQDDIINEKHGTFDIGDLFLLLEQLNAGSGGKDEKQLIRDFIDNSSFDLYQLLEYAIDRTIRAGIDVKGLVNAIPELSYLITPYMRCEKEEKLDTRITYPAIAQVKADGLFINMICDEDIKFVTRYGNKVDFDGPLKVALKNLLSEIVGEKSTDISTQVIMGELLVLDQNGEPLPREVGNGLLNSLFKRVATERGLEAKLIKAKTPKAKKKLMEEQALNISEWENTRKNIVAKVWDIVPYEDYKKLSCSIPYSDRLETLKTLLANVPSPSINIIDTKIVNSKNDIYNYYGEVLDKGEEGLVVKNFNITWKHGTSTEGMIKMKEFFDCDLKITGWVPGEDSYTGGIGALICESSDGIIKVDPSSGLSMAQRGLQRVDEEDSSKGWEPIPCFDLNQYTGLIAAIKFNTLMVEKEDGTRSLFLPKIVEIRDPSDKREADSIEDILSEIKSKK
jgi:DNA ligase-1